MIYTVTFNPSLDYTVHMPVFQAGAINRTEQEAVYPGGKGINVGIILHRLGLPVRLLGFVAGFTGAEIERLAGLAGCPPLQERTGMEEKPAVPHFLGCWPPSPWPC